MDMCLLYSLLTLSQSVRLTTEEVGASAMRVDVTLASGIDKKQDYFQFEIVILFSWLTRQMSHTHKSSYQTTALKVKGHCMNLYCTS